MGGIWPTTASVPHVFRMHGMSNSTGVPSATRPDMTNESSCRCVLFGGVYFLYYDMFSVSVYLRHSVRQATGNEEYVLCLFALCVMGVALTKRNFIQSGVCVENAHLAKRNSYRCAPPSPNTMLTQYIPRPVRSRVGVYFTRAGTQGLPTYKSTLCWGEGGLIYVTLRDGRFQCTRRYQVFGPQKITRSPLCLSPPIPVSRGIQPGDWEASMHA
jgi:hypothetical protein